MTEGNFSHFENLWEAAEKSSYELYKSLSTNEILNKIIELANKYKNINDLELPKEIKSSLKKDSVGEILYLLTYLSFNDNINVFSALKEEL